MGHGQFLFFIGSTLWGVCAGGAVKYCDFINIMRRKHQSVLMVSEPIKYSLFFLSAVINLLNFLDESCHKEAFCHNIYWVHVVSMPHMNVVKVISQAWSWWLECLKLNVSEFRHLWFDVLGGEVGQSCVSILIGAVRVECCTSCWTIMIIRRTTCVTLAYALALQLSNYTGSVLYRYTHCYGILYILYIQCYT